MCTQGVSREAQVRQLREGKIDESRPKRACAELERSSDGCGFGGRVERVPAPRAATAASAAPVPQRYHRDEVRHDCGLGHVWEPHTADGARGACLLLRGARAAARCQSRGGGGGALRKRDCALLFRWRGAASRAVLAPRASRLLAHATHPTPAPPRTPHRSSIARLCK